MKTVPITPPYIKLEQFLKLCNITASGGVAKILIQSGQILVNGEVCLMRGKKLTGGEIISLKNETKIEDSIFEVAVKHDDY